jgi:hypothetical protein
MPVKPLAKNPNLDHLRYQAKDLLKAHAARDVGAAQRIREFHPRFNKSTDAEIFGAQLKLSDAQLAIAREYGFPSWTRLKRRVEKPLPGDDLDLPYRERIEDLTFRQAVDLLDGGDLAGLLVLLNKHPGLVHQRVLFEGGNYFRNPTLLEFVAENPIRNGILPANIVQVAEVILNAGASQNPSAMNETLGLVSSGRVPRESGVQLRLIDLLCDHGADPNHAMPAALAHGEFEAVNTLIRRGGAVNLAVAAGLGRFEDARRLLGSAGGEERHRALALASQFGHTDVVRLLLDAGEDPNRFNPVGFHSHSTPLHQAALAGHEEVVRLLVERGGARLDAMDTLWQGTPAGWAKHAGRTDIEEYLLRRQRDV